MKKSLLILLLLALLFSLTSCFNDVTEFQEKDGNTYYYEYSDGIKTVTNYHPHKLWALPNYQEMVQYGDGAGLENEGVVYFVYVVDTSIDAESPQAYYMAELNGETKELLCDDGEYFTDEAEKNAFITRLVDLVDSVNFK